MKVNQFEMKKQLLPLAAIAVAITAIILSVISANDSKSLAYFDYNKVYNECQLKKDLEKDLEKVVGVRKSELDSMQLELSFMSNKVQSGSANQEELNQFEDLKNRFLTYQGKYEEENIRLKEQYFNQIRTKINELSKEYAEEHGFDYFFSAAGDGSLMYADKSEDVTEDFLEYVNGK